MRGVPHERKSIRHRNKNGYFLTVCPLDDRFVVARAVKPLDIFVDARKVTVIPFVIIDNSTGEVLQDLSHWVVPPQASWAFHNVKFEAIYSCSGRYTIIIGPDENSHNMKTTKVLTRKQPFTLRLNVSIILISKRCVRNMITSGGSRISQRKGSQLQRWRRQLIIWSISPQNCMSMKKKLGAVRPRCPPWIRQDTDANVMHTLRIQTKSSQMNNEICIHSIWYCVNS